MKRKKSAASFTWVGAFAFFVLVALLMQIAILVYDYICERTSNPSTIAILILILILILSSLITLFDWIRRKLTVERPTKRILDATQKIAQGDFSTRLEITHEYDKYNQYDWIMENLNKMASALQKNEVLSMDFVSNVSHEIKTPLAVIQNYASLLQRVDLDDKTRKEYSQTLIDATTRISTLVSNVLQLNKLENQVQQKNQEFNLTETVAESVLSFENLIESKNIELSCHLDEVEVVSNKSLLEIVLNNLMGNAVKFTNDGGSISVVLKTVGNDAQITIADTGIGMSPEVGAHIFEKFYQGDASHSTKGNGLGLALVKRVIDVLGGEITVNSQLGVGSTFTILLKDVVNEK